MERTFTATRIAEPTASVGMPQARPMPTVAAGGMSATAMATPTSAEETPVMRLVTPATPAPSATTSERKFGRRRSRTSARESTSRPGGTTWVVFTRNANAAAPATDSRTPTAWRRTPRANNSSSSTTVPTLADIAGPSSGAMTIDPTTVAGESRRRPAVAMTVLTTVRTAYVIREGARSSARATSSARAMRSPLVGSSRS